MQIAESSADKSITGLAITTFGIKNVAAAAATLSAEKRNIFFPLISSTDFAVNVKIKIINISVATAVL